MNGILCDHLQKRLYLFELWILPISLLAGSYKTLTLNFNYCENG